MPSSSGPLRGRAPVARLERRSPGWRRLRPVALAVLAAGLAITGLLTWAAFVANARSNASLLDLQARQTASALSAALPEIQTRLSDALTVATATNSPATFEKFVASAGNGSNLVSESLWKRTTNGARLLTTVGSPPQLARTGEATRFFATMQPRPGLQVTSILAGSPPRLGYAEYPSSDSRYIVYAESRLPAGKHLAIPKSSPFAELNFALYLGRGTHESSLIGSSVPTPVTGDHATVNVPFGDTALTLVATPRRSLTPWTSQALRWIALGGGLALSFASAAAVDYLSERRRLANALNAQLTALYGEQRSIAETLQHALLPARLPEVDGMEIAARYSPGAKGADIGGDWYDVIVLDSDRVVFIVGDVSGRGVSAAAIMARLRFAGRGFALEGHSPAAILGRLATMLDFGTDGHFATVLCGLVDVARHEVHLANAGHLPPLVCSNGSVALLDAPPSPPIGVATANPAKETQAQLPPGAMLLAYTDGLIERRGQTFDQSVRRLQESVGQGSCTVGTLLDTVMSDLAMDGPDDDIAVLGLKWLT